MSVRVRVRFILPALLALGVVVCWSAGAAYAQACPAETEQVRALEPYAAALPDCRAYEQVSPAAKNLNDVAVRHEHTQAAPSGDGVLFYTTNSFPGAVGSSEYPVYVATRGGGWSSQGLEPQTESCACGYGTPAATIAGVTEDLSLAFIRAGGEAESPAGVLTSRESTYVDRVADSAFTPFLPFDNIAGATADDATPDGPDVLFESHEKLLPGAVEGEGAPNLYEWGGGQLRLVGVLPGGDGTPAGGVRAGPGRISYSSRLQSIWYTQGTISEDGSRVFFTALASGRIYMREPDAERTVEVSAGEAEWLAATPNGAYVFYLEGGKLYRFSAEGGARELLTVGAAPGALGMFGASNDSSESYVYFAATGVLTEGKNVEGREPVPGEPNVYEWHEGAATPVTFVVTLPGYDGFGGAPGGLSSYAVSVEDFNYSNFRENQGSIEKLSRVASDGEAMVFSTVQRLTDYQNHGEPEVYLYSAVSGRLTCVSCNPSGRPATFPAALTYEYGSVIAKKSTGELALEYNAHLTRNLSGDGSRVFFQTEEPLLPGDTDGVMDVYEWEDGRLFLISSGKGSSPAYFGDASANGDDVFFYTRQSLVGQDQDDNTDIYDARVDGGLLAQNPVAVAPCVGEACRAVQGAAPVFGSPSSATFVGPGDPLAVGEPAPSAVKAKALSRAQRLELTLKACRKKPRAKRVGCEAEVRRRYGTKAKKSAVRSSVSGGR